jgi:hypothetical protein
MRELFQSTKVRLFDEGGLKEMFDHLRNLLMATLIIAAGSYGIRQAPVVELLGVLDVEIAGYFVVVIGVLLAAYWMMIFSAKLGTAALLVLVRKVAADKVLEGLRGEGGTVMKISLDHTKEAALQAALAGVQAAVPASPS